MCEVLDKDIIKFELRLHLSVAKCGCVSKSDRLVIVWRTLYKLRASFLWHIMREKAR